MSAKTEFSIHCPISLSDYPNILLAHGGGGKLTHQLIERMFLPAFKSKSLDARHDGAILDFKGMKLAFTTDSYVVHPLFFPGGDIGSMAVYGTVNDLAMCGAKPLYLSVGFILEEGLETHVLSKIVHSMAFAAERSSVELVTGDTKVVDHGKGDGLFINTAGVGIVDHALDIAPRSIQVGDQILLSGDLGRHGMAIMATREGLAFESQIESDSAPLWGLVGKLLEKRIEIHCLRDLTRGGLSSALNEIAQSRNIGISVHEEMIPVREDIRASCEILGLDPLYVANEGRCIVFVPPADAKKTLDLMRSSPEGQGSVIIGEVKENNKGVVLMKNRLGTHRVIDMLSGEQLPRIC